MVVVGVRIGDSKDVLYYNAGGCAACDAYEAEDALQERHIRLLTDLSCIEDRAEEVHDTAAGSSDVRRSSSLCFLEKLSVDLIFRLFQ